MEKLIDFMNEKQRDPRLNEISFPLYGDKRVMEIINKYEKSEENRKNSNVFYLKLFFFVLSVWKYQDFSVSQILREINFGGCRSSKLAVFAIFGPPNF